MKNTPKNAESKAEGLQHETLKNFALQAMIATDRGTLEKVFSFKIDELDEDDFESLPNLPDQLLEEPGTISYAYRHKQTKHVWIATFRKNQKGGVSFFTPPAVQILK